MVSDYDEAKNILRNYVEETFDKPVADFLDVSSCVIEEGWKKLSREYDDRLFRMIARMRIAEKEHAGHVSPSLYELTKKMEKYYFKDAGIDVLKDSEGESIIKDRLLKLASRVCGE